MIAVVEEILGGLLQGMWENKKKKKRKKERKKDLNISEVCAKLQLAPGVMKTPEKMASFSFLCK